MFQSWCLGSIVVSSGFEEMPASERTSRLSISILQKIQPKHSRTGLICLSLAVFVSPWFLLSLILPTSLQVSIRVFSKHTLSNQTSLHLTLPLIVEMNIFITSFILYELLRLWIRISILAETGKHHTDLTWLNSYHIEVHQVHQVIVTKFSITKLRNQFTGQRVGHSGKHGGFLF